MHDWFVSWKELNRLVKAGAVNRKMRKARTVAALRWYADHRAKRSKYRMADVLAGGWIG